MPLKSKAQQRWMAAAEDRGELPKGTLHRWAAHTKNLKKLPEHVEKKAEERRRFVTAFLVKCARAGLTTPAQLAEAAEGLAAVTTKRATVLGDLAGKAVGLGSWAPLVGSVGLPLALGFGVGGLAAGAKNQADTDDSEVLRLRAQANAYRRRAAEAKTHAQVRQLVGANPNQYVVLS